ncbi:TnpV protein [Alkalibaculum bacchi]
MELETTEAKPIGKYGSLRLMYLMKNNKVLYNSLSIQGKLQQHLVEINERANERLEKTIKQMMETYEVTENLKENNQMEWVRQVNNIKAMCEEVIYEEMIYA